MARRAVHFASASLLLLGLSGCPVTDDYYLFDDAAGGSDASTAGASGSASGSTNEGGKASQAGSSQGGTPAAGTGPKGGEQGTSGDAGAPNPGQAGTSSGDAGSAAMAGAGGDGGEPCVQSTERCNGHDDDCDGVVDEFACLSNCSGFVLQSSPEHGYMFCTSARKANWNDAKKACEDQDMRLAWLDSAEENAAVADKLDSLGSDAEVLFGATDQGNEGDWIWFGGEQFWKGNAPYGMPVGGRYNNWAEGTPNNAQNNEDCALIIVESGAWGDRACYATYPYVCEQPD